MNYTKSVALTLVFSFSFHGIIFPLHLKNRVLHAVHGLKNQSSLFPKIGHNFQPFGQQSRRTMFSGVIKFVAENADKIAETTKNVVTAITAATVTGAVVNDLAQGDKGKPSNQQEEEKGQKTAANKSQSSYNDMLDVLFGDNPESDSYRGPKSPENHSPFPVNKKPEEQSAYSNFLDSIFGDNPASPSYRGNGPIKNNSNPTSNNSNSGSGNNNKDPKNDESKEEVAKVAAVATSMQGDKPASTPVGRSGATEMNVTAPNVPANINGTKFTGHALDQMQSRGVTSPSAVIDAVNNPTNVSSGNIPGTQVYSNADLTVVTNLAGDIVTVIPK